MFRGANCHGGAGTKDLRVLDLGTGASLVYPLIGVRLWGGTFVGVDSEQKSIDNCQWIVRENGL